MASPTPTELARKALDEIKDLQAEVLSLRKEIGQYDFLQAVQRLAVIEEKLAKLEKTQDEVKQIAVLLERVNELKKAKDESDKQSVRAAVTGDRVSKLEKKEEESGKRQWQFVYIAAGAGFALLSSFLFQLVFYFLKK